MNSGLILVTIIGFTCTTCSIIFALNAWGNSRLINKIKDPNHISMLQKSIKLDIKISCILRTIGIILSISSY